MTDVMRGEPKVVSDLRRFGMYDASLNGSSSRGLTPATGEAIKLSWMMILSSIMMIRIGSITPGV